MMTKEEAKDEMREEKESKMYRVQLTTISLIRATSPEQAEDKALMEAEEEAENGDLELQAEAEVLGE